MMEARPLEPDPRVKQAKVLLKKTYYNASDPGGYGGARRLLTSVRSKAPPELLPLLNTKFVGEWLKGQQGYTLHRPARKHFPRRKIVTGGIDHQWQADLADLSSYAEANDGYKWLLVVVDVFSKYAWAVPTKNKSATEVLDAMRKVFLQAAPRKPQKLQTDKGLEFMNRQVQAYLQKQGVHHFASESDQKAACAERFNRTIKTKIAVGINTHQNERWIDRIDDYLTAYNNAVHRTIGMPPSAVRPEHKPILWKRMYRESFEKPIEDTQPIPSEAKVRISNVKGDFAKGYYPNWSEEHFHIRDIQRKPGGKTQYYLREDNGDTIKGGFNREEIQHITKNRYRIKVLRKRTVPAGRGRRKTEYFVEWIGWPASYNSWISEEQLTKIQPHGESI